MPKTFKNNAESSAGMVLSDTALVLLGKKDCYIGVTDKGTTICGPISIVSDMKQVRTGTMWTFNNNMTLSLPSTLATPHPVLNIDPPVRQIAGLMADAAVMIGLIGGFAAIAAV